MRVGDRRRGGSRGRLLGLVALATVLLAFTRPGRRAVRELARRLDSHVEAFSEPNASGYARFIATALRPLYERVADDVATELAARGDGVGGGRGLAILDIGCGPGDLAAMLAERLVDARVVGLDLSPSMVELARRRETAGGRISFEVGDAASLPFESGSIDLVVSTLSLHHWPNAGAGFLEIGRVLRPDGMALVYDLRLLTVGAEELPDVARLAGLPASRLLRERLSGGLCACLFVRFRVEGPAAEPAPDAALAAGAAGHARIPAAVTPGEVA
jgi:SAM-dependent methyltransferase